MKRIYFNQYQLTEAKNCKYLIAFLIFISLYIGRDTLVCNELLGFYASQILTALIFIVYGIIFLVTNRRSFKKIIMDIRMVIFVSFSILFTGIMILKQDFTLTYMSMIFALAFALFISYIADFKTIARYFVYTICFFTVYSLITNYILRGLLFSNVDKLPMLTNSAGNEFINMGFSFILNRSDYYRNFCIYREPGVFQFFLIFSLLFETFLIDHHMKKKVTIISVLCIGMLSTFSTTGFIELLLYFLLLFVLHYKSIFSSKKRVILIMSLSSAIIIGFAFVIQNNSDLYWTFRPMITKLFTSNESLMARLESITGNISIFVHHPFLGDNVSNVLNGVTHNTSSSLVMFSMFGMVVGVIYFAIWLLHIQVYCMNQKLSISKASVNLLLFLIVFISFNCENLISNLYFTIIPILSLMESDCIRSIDTIKKRISFLLGKSIES